MAILVQSADGLFRQLASAQDANGAHTIATTPEAPTTYFNLLQPNGQWAKIGAVIDGSGVLTMCARYS